MVMQIFEAIGAFQTLNMDILRSIISRGIVAVETYNFLVLQPLWYYDIGVPW